MKISARNQLSGKVKSVKSGPIDSEVTLALPGGLEIVAVITSTSVKKLGLKKGSTATAIIKASTVLLAVE
jgi:molybdate transport system regulatory protein